MLKILMSWDIVPSKEKDFLDFLLQDFTPAVQKLGIQPTDAWLTVYGRGPQVLAGGIVDNDDAAFSILASDEWRDLEQRLLKMVTNYRRRVIQAEGGFQL